MLRKYLESIKFISCFLETSCFSEESTHTIFLKHFFQGKLFLNLCHFSPSLSLLHFIRTFCGWAIFFLPVIADLFTIFVTWVEIFASHVKLKWWSLNLTHEYKNHSHCQKSILYLLTLCSLFSSDYLLKYTLVICSCLNQYLKIWILEVCLSSQESNNSFINLFIYIICKGMSFFAI